MKKSILNLKGAQELTKNEQKSINGGMPPLLPCGAVCTHVGNSGCKSGQCEVQLEEPIVAICVC